jgi:hypothetical protein
MVGAHTHQPTRGAAAKSGDAGLAARASAGSRLSASRSATTSVRGSASIEMPSRDD